MNIEKLIKFIEKEGKVELSEDFKGKLEDAIKVVVVEKDGEIDSLKDVLKEAKEEIETSRADLQTLKESTLEGVKKDVEGHKAALVEKISGYLETELKNLVPDSLIEAQAKVEAYEPIVEKVKDVFKGYGVELDSDSHAVLKEAKEEILSLQKSYDEINTEKLAIEEKASELLAKYILKEKCDGLTDEQTSKINVIFKGSDADEISEKFESVRDLIIDEGDSEDDEDDDDEKKKKKKEAEEAKGKGSEKVEESAGSDDAYLKEDEDLGQKYL